MPGVNSCAGGEKGQSPSLHSAPGVQTGCPALLLTDHIAGAAGPPAFQGWLQLGPWLEQQIKLWGKERDKNVKCSVLVVDVGGAVKLICENQA